LVDDVHRGARLGGVSLHAVARPPGHLGDGAVHGAEDPQGAVAKAVTRRACGQHRLHQCGGEQGFLGAGDPNGDGLRLVLDGVDWASQLLDALRQRGDEVVEQGTGRAHLPVLQLVDRKSVV
jgi:hypothetical protein